MSVEVKVKRIVMTYTITKVKYKCGEKSGIFSPKDEVDEWVEKDIILHEKTCIKCLRKKKLEKLKKLNK